MFFCNSVDTFLSEFNEYGPSLKQDTDVSSKILHIFLQMAQVAEPGLHAARSCACFVWAVPCLPLTRCRRRSNMTPHSLQMRPVAPLS